MKHHCSARRLTPATASSVYRIEVEAEVLAVRAVGIVELVVVHQVAEPGHGPVHLSGIGSFVNWG